MTDKRAAKMQGASAYAAYANDVTFRLGPIQSRGRLVGIRKPADKQATKTKLCTPEGMPVEQRYVDASGELWVQRDLAKAYVTEESVDAGTVQPGPRVIVTTGTRKDKVVSYGEIVVGSLESQLAKGVFNFSIHNADEVENKVFPSDQNGYVFEVDTEDPVNVAQAQMLLSALEQAEGKVFLAMGLLRTEGLYQVFLWHGHIAIQKMLYPSDVNEFDATVDAFPAESVEAQKVKLLTEALVEPFNPEAYQATMTERQIEDKDEANNDAMILLDSFLKTLEA